MRNKNSISKKLERLESILRNLNYSIGTSDRTLSYKHLDKAKEQLSDINTLLNRETQE
jgi:hypothetical protein